MALTQQEQTAVRAIITRDGGLDNVIDEIRDLAIADKRAAAVTALGNAVTVTVNNWNIPANYVAQATGETLVSVINDITATWVAQDATKLGALLIQLYAAAKKHLAQ